MDWQKEDLKYIWHPCSQMKDYETLPPIVIERGKGINLYDINGKCYKDVISSWWCNLLGHCHPRINAAIKKQVDTLEHVIFANFSHKNKVSKYIIAHFNYIIFGIIHADSPLPCFSLHSLHIPLMLISYSVTSKSYFVRILSLRHIISPSSTSKTFSQQLHII